MPELVKAGDFVGDIFHQWDIAEYEQHKDRPKRWYIAVAVLGSLLLLYAILRSNFWFMFIILLFGIILFLQHKQTPPRIPVGVTSTGVILGNRLYPYAELTSFYIIYSPPEVQTLYIETEQTLRPLLRIPIPDDVNPIAIRENLLLYLEEDLEKEEEPLSDKLARQLRIQ